MFRTLILSAACLAPTISALAYPKETGVVNKRGAAPAPTNGPKLLGAIRARDDVPNGCGYVDGDPDKEIGCDYGQVCNYWFAAPQLSSSAFGVGAGGVYCSPIAPSSSASSIAASSYYPPQACQAYDGGKYNTASDSVTLDQTLYCGSANKECATLYFKTEGQALLYSSWPAQSSLAHETFTHLLCATTKTTGTVYPTPTD